MTTPTTGRTDEAPARRTADLAGWLALAAAPTFAGMAWLASGDATMPGAPAPGGMAGMYLLMSLFHLPPWLRLASCCRAASHQPRHPDTGD